MCSQTKLSLNKECPQLTCSFTCSLPYSVIPNKLLSTLRASSPWLEPGESPCFGEEMTFRTVFLPKNGKKADHSGLPPLNKECVSVPITQHTLVITDPDNRALRLLLLC